MSSRWIPLLRSVMAGLMLAVPTFAQTDGPSLTPEEMREDLTYLRETWAPQDRSFNDSQRNDFNRLIDETAAAVEHLAPEQFALEVMRAVAIARNGHTNANAVTLLGPDIPVRVWLFPDGLHIVKTHPDFARLLGARIDKIGSLTPQEALDALRVYLPGTDQRIRFLSPGYLVTPTVLKQIGAIKDAAVVPLTVQFADGRSETVELAPARNEDPGDERRENLNRGYSVLRPDDANLPGRWNHLLDGRSDLPPVYSKRSDLQAQFLDEARKVLYIRSDMVKSMDETALSDKFAGLFHEKILPVRPKHIVVDLRFNPGGDLFNTILFSQALPRLVPRDGQVFVLVGRATFSAAISTAAMLKGSGGDKVTLIGEEMGDGSRFWAEGKHVKLPNSGIAVRYSPELHDYETGCFKLGDCYWATVAFGPRGISITPETTVDLAYDAYAAGRDPLLEKVLDIIHSP